jgi:hypothetical protein
MRTMVKKRHMRISLNKTETRIEARTENAGPPPEGTGRRFRRSTAVAVGFEPTLDFHPHTLSSSANPRSGTVARVRHVLDTPVRECHRTPADDDE